MAPPEFTAGRWAGLASTASLMTRMDQRGHWVCLSLGLIGGPDATAALIGKLDSKDTMSF
jgi:hypothetical protein